jgi:uroporphyrinogen III methyltransferase / synthase
MRARAGWVYLVGAGPGDPGLITARGLELLRTCDVVLYDRLVSPQLLDEAPAGAEKIFVGKKPGETHSRQVVSDALLVSKARESKSVVRLKGGDPFVFGRGAEEAALLRDASVPFELVPGVSSAIAAPAYAGIPVTHRGISASFVVLTAREEEGESPEIGAVASGADTVVLLMGVAALGEVAKGLIAAGRSEDEPAATISWGTTGRQRVVTSTLAAIAADVAAAGLTAPATTVVGQVVAMRENIAWFEARPLVGRTVAVTRPAAQSKELTARLSELGAEIVPLPLIDIDDPSSWDAVDDAIGHLSDYQWVIFASSNAVERTMSRVSAAGLDARAFAGCKIAAVGARTAHVLEHNGLRPDLVPERSDAMSVVEEIGDGTGKVLFPRVEDAPSEPIRALEKNGWTVDEVAVYRNIPGNPEPAALARASSGEVDIVTLTSASTARNLRSIVGDVDGAAIVCIGPSTAQATVAQGYDVAASASSHDVDGLVEAVLRVARNIES